MFQAVFILCPAGHRIWGLYRSGTTHISSLYNDGRLCYVFDTSFCHSPTILLLDALLF